MFLASIGPRMISEMISTMQENLQAEATKKAYCDAEMGKASDKKAELFTAPVIQSLGESLELWCLAKIS